MLQSSMTQNDERLNKSECCDASEGNCRFKSVGPPRTEGQRVSLRADSRFALLPPAGLVLHIPSNQQQQQKTYLGSNALKSC